MIPLTLTLEGSNSTMNNISSTKEISSTLSHLVSATFFFNNILVRHAFR